ncbi:hypothetical protein Tco_1458748 [Tanacetum coccineum]
MDSMISTGQKNTLAEYMIAINIILQGLPTDIYSLMNHHRVAKDLWEKVQLLMQGTSLTKQEKECKLCDAFDKFTHIKGESLYLYYLRFTQLINDINIYNMKLEQFQVNTKFLNSLLPEWSKFVTDGKLVKDLHTTNFDQLYAYLEQHELHANEVRLMCERNQDPLALSHQYGSTHPTQHYSTTYPSTPHAITYPSAPYPHAYSLTAHQEACSQPQSVPQIEYIGRHNYLSLELTKYYFSSRTNTSRTGGNNQVQQDCEGVFKDTAKSGRGHISHQDSIKAKEEKGCYVVRGKSSIGRSSRKW